MNQCLWNATATQWGFACLIGAAEPYSREQVAYKVGPERYSFARLQREYGSSGDASCKSAFRFRLKDLRRLYAAMNFPDEIDTGHELVIIGYGASGWCGMCRSQLANATFRDWFRGEVQYAASKGIEVSAYTLQQHNGWGESVPPEETTLARDGVTRGPTACFATTWHAQYQQSVLDFMGDVGLRGVETARGSRPGRPYAAPLLRR